jgi:hypothetical protein
MFLKAGFIIAIFMHVVWERLALVLTILGPPSVLLVLIGMMTVEGKYAEEARFNYMGHDRNAVALTPADLHVAKVVSMAKKKPIKKFSTKGVGSPYGLRYQNQETRKLSTVSLLL